MVQKNAGAKSMRIKTMKSHLIATLGLAALLAIPAHAADMPLLRKAAPVVMEDPWTGLYVGVDGGWGWANSTHSTSTGNLGSFDQKGWVAGGGLEFMPLPQWTLRGEFLHADMSSNLEANDLNGGFFFGNGVTTVSEHNINIVRFGITYYLGADRGIASGVSSKY
jgi:opacity protein-like surface antigen